MAPPEYTCAMCGETYQSDWTTDEAAQELAENFGVEDPADAAVVCDDCYKLLLIRIQHPQPH